MNVTFWTIVGAIVVARIFNNIIASIGAVIVKEWRAAKKEAS